MKPLVRNILITIALVLIILIVCGLFGLGVSNEPLLPKLNKASEKLESHCFQSYNDIVSLMLDEEYTATQEKIVQEYIAADFYGYTRFFNIKIFSSGTGVMSHKIFNSENLGDKDSEVIHNKQITLTEKQTTEIISIIENNNFWDIPSIHPDATIGLDGQTIFIEGVNKSKYNIISMWCPDKTLEIYKIYTGIMDCAERWGLEK